MCRYGIPKRLTCHAWIVATSTVVMVGCTHPKQDIIAPSTCYEGPVDLHVQYADGSPAANLPIGLGIMLWQPDSATGAPVTFYKTPRTNANGDYRRDRWRECMLPTWLYAMDESRQLAAFETIPSYDRIKGPHVLTLRPACRVIGRVGDANLRGQDPSERSVLVNLNPGFVLTSRYLKYQSTDGQFAFLVPPGEYLLSISTSQAQSKGITIDVPRDVSRLDVGVVRFEMTFEYAPAER